MEPYQSMLQLFVLYSLVDSGHFAYKLVKYMSESIQEEDIIYGIIKRFSNMRPTGLVTLIAKYSAKPLADNI